MTTRIDWKKQFGRNFKLRDLHIFFTVAQCGSMGKAAATLGIAQPTVSEAVADLEHTFGVKLLDRSTRGVEPTACGAALLKRSIAVFDELRSSSKDIESLSDPASGEINIGSLPALTGAILPRLIERFGQQYPRAVLNIDDVDTLATQLARLRDRKYDLTLSRLPRSPLKRDDLNVEVLYEDGIVLAAGMHSRWARRRKIDLAELVDEPWLIFDSANSELIDLLRESAPQRGVGTTFWVDCVAIQAWSTWRTVGGRATPAAESARLAAGRGGERSRKHLSSCSTLVSVSESRSARISGHEPFRPRSAMRSSSSFLRTRARKLQDT
jgi:DNA-binding transcriptional LysR family regulator